MELEVVVPLPCATLSRNGVDSHKRGRVYWVHTNQEDISMTNAEKTIAFFAATDSKTKQAILQNIASHYGISAAAAEAEVTDEDAESLLDYLTGETRTATSLLMKRHRLA